MRPVPAAIALASAAFMVVAVNKGRPLAAAVLSLTAVFCAYLAFGVVEHE